GVGTRLGTSMDAPSLNTVYKLVADAAGPKMKRSEGKATLPGRKQVYRSADHDVLALADERMDGRPLLGQVMAGGRRVDGRGALEPRPDLRQRRQGAEGDQRRPRQGPDDDAHEHEHVEGGHQALSQPAGARLADHDRQRAGAGGVVPGDLVDVLAHEHGGA